MSRRDGIPQGVSSRRLFFGCLRCGKVGTYRRDRRALPVSEGEIKCLRRRTSIVTQADHLTTEAAPAEHSVKHISEVNDAESLNLIKVRAYVLWEQTGKPDGDFGERKTVFGAKPKGTLSRRGLKSLLRPRHGFTRCFHLGRRLMAS